MNLGEEVVPVNADDAEPMSRAKMNSLKWYS